MKDKSIDVLPGDPQHVNLDETQHIQVLEDEQRPIDVLHDICVSSRQDDAFFVCDLDAVVKRYLLWKQHLLQVQPFYAVKSNGTTAVLKTLAALGVGFDCATKNEMDDVLALGVDPIRIIYAHTAKPESHLKHAAAARVNLTTCDSDDELHKIKRLHPDTRILLRIRCDAARCYRNLGVKYGCSVETGEAERLLQVARALELRVAGVCFHVGSGCDDPPVFRRALRLASHVCRLGEALGFSMSVLDIGGGFPGHDSGEEFQRMSQVISASIDEFFPSKTDLEIIAEPGRFFVTSAFTLAANVHSRRILRNACGDIENVMYFINSGIHNGFRLFLKDHVHGKPLKQTEQQRNLFFSSVWGPTEDENDAIENQVQLPLLDVGSWLVYSNMGAYSLTCSGEFSGFSAPKVYIVATRDTRFILHQKA